MEGALLEEGSAQEEPLRFDYVVGRAQCPVAQPRMSWTLLLLLDQLPLLPVEESPLAASNSREASSEASARVETSSLVKI